MYNFTPDQHSKIIGWAVTGYGIGFATAAILTILQTLSIGDARTTVAGFVWSSVVGNFIMLIICLTAGATIRNRSRDVIDLIFGEFNFQENESIQFKGSSILLFVLGAVWLFPLGTFLSLYSLVFLFVIDSNDRNEQAKSANINKNDE